MAASKVILASFWQSETTKQLYWLIRTKRHLLRCHHCNRYLETFRCPCLELVIPTEDSVLTID